MLVKHLLVQSDYAGIVADNRSHEVATVCVVIGILIL